MTPCVRLVPGRDVLSSASTYPVAESAQPAVFAIPLVANEPAFTHYSQHTSPLGESMPAFRFQTSLAVAGLSLAMAALVLPGSSFAYTQEEQQACSPDAMRLCGEFVPNVDAITACMIKKKSQLSPQCAVYFRRGPEPSEAATQRVGKPTNIAPKKTAKPKKKKPEPS